MKLHHITDEDEWLNMRKKYITSTEIASLFGVEMPSMPTAYELWHTKNGKYESEIVENERMIWGRRLEEPVARGIAEDNGFKIKKLDVFACDDDLRMGSSFDYEIIQKDGRKGLLEIKTVAYKEYVQKFIEDSELDSEGQPFFIEAPEYYEFQVQHQLEIFDKYDFACLAVFILDTRQTKLIWRERDKEMGAAIRKKIKEFWDLKSPDGLLDLERDSELFARFHRAHNVDASYDATDDDEFELAAITYIQEHEREKAAKAEKNIARSTMLLKMGTCNSAWCNKARVSNKSRFQVTESKKKGKSND